MRDVEHLEVGMERGEVQRDVGAEVLDDPARHRVELLVGCRCWPGISSVVISTQTSVSCTRYSSVSSTVGEVRAAHVPVEVLGERLQVDVGGVHVRVELAARLGQM